MPVTPPVNVHRSAATCRSAVPTVSLPAPDWFESENAPWACLRDPTPRVLLSTDQCRDCPHWQARKRASHR